MTLEALEALPSSAFSEEIAVMSARDKYHDVVRNALIQEGWTITHDPYRITIGRRRGYIDLGAEMPLAAEKEGRRIAVEVKSFLGASELDDLENALGQYGMYRVMLAKRDPGRALYLAVPDDLRTLLLDERDFVDILQAFQTRLIFFDPQQERILEWIETTNTEEL
jgi:XisH protein